ILDARIHGAQTLTYHEVKEIIKEQGRVIGVKVYDHINKEEKQVYGQIVVNTGGIWGQHLAEMAGVSIKMYPAKGSLLIFGHRINKYVLNRCRKPADADILVPGDTICLIGYDHINKEEKQVYGQIVVNTGGIWGQHLAEMAGVSIKMYPAKGSLLIFGHRINKYVLNRLYLMPGFTVRKR
ncbi:FAD dependent oxidoreductase, partial [Popillia japonica]